MLKSLWQKILALFGKTTQTTDKEYCSNDKYSDEYEDISEINFNAMFSKRLSNYVCNGSTLNVDGENKRTELLNEFISEIWKSKNKTVSRIFGTGGVVIVPYVNEGKVYYEMISQSSLSINSKQGGKIIDATILADTYIRNDVFTSTTFYRWADYTIVDDTLYINQRYTNDQGELVTPKPDIWEDVNDEFIIPNVDRVLFAYFLSPVDNRTTSDLYGVPITYGTDSTIAKIIKTLSDIDREYEIKKSFVGADETMFNGDNALPTNGLYRKVDAGVDDFWEVFDPSIRESAYYTKLTNELAMLEKEVGTSKGILTEPLSTYQNVDEVRRALFDTLSIVNEMRDNITDGLKDLLYSVDVLANYFNLTPQGDYVINTTWGKGLTESFTETLNNLNVGLEKGYISKAEVRNTIKDNETMEESEQAISELEAKNPTAKQLLGTE